MKENKDNVELIWQEIDISLFTNVNIIRVENFNTLLQPTSLGYKLYKSTGRIFGENLNNSPSYGSSRAVGLCFDV